MKISVVLPVYEQFGKGISFLKQSLDILKEQTYTDFEVVISDNSETEDIKQFLHLYKELPINYFKNLGQKNMSGNLNNAILKARGDYIKILFQDDCLLGINALHDLSQFDGTWLITACSNNHHPFYSEQMKWGVNTIGSPSVLMIKNDQPLLFDETLNWVVDLDYYVRLFNRYGFPTILPIVNVMIGLGEHQLTNRLTYDEKLKEVNLLCQKYS